MGDVEAPQLRRLLRAAGYQLEDRPVGLRAVRARDHRAVLVVDGPRLPPEVEREFPADAVRRTLVYPDDPGAEIRELAAERGMEVLDPLTLGPALGELLLDPAAPAPPVPGERSTGLAAPAAIFPEGERTVKARLTADDARRLAGVLGFRAVLRYVPFFVVPYRVRPASAHGAPGRPSDHLAAVHALSGRVEIWEPGERELVADDRVAELRLAPTWGGAEALAAAAPAVRRLHTVSVDHVEQHGGALVIERRRVPPGADDLAFGAPVLVHVPYWYVEGREGRLVIDAVSGATALPDEPELSVDQ